MLTFLVTAFFLAPTSKNGYFSLYLNSNLFFHFIIPILSFVSFVFLESTKQIAFRYTFAGMIPMVVYAVFYIANVLVHIENGEVLKEYDWYGFLMGGLWTIVIVIPVIFFVTYLISFVLWWLNRVMA